jgi:hypothetical protein
MMQDQRKHELQWYQERQALKQAQEGRLAASAKAHAILQSLGSSTSGEGVQQPDDEHFTELTNFDRKIYAAQLAMDEAMSGEMKGLGVPFFGTKQHLIVSDATNELETSAEGQGKWSAPITEAELMALRRKMVGHLEDLYRD